MNTLDKLKTILSTFSNEELISELAERGIKFTETRQENKTIESKIEIKEKKIINAAQAHKEAIGGLSGAGSGIKWVKLLTKINKEEKTGYAFEGNMLSKEIDEVPIGSYIMVHGTNGSAKNWYAEATVFLVAEETLKLVYNSGDLGQSGWALKIRDKIAEVTSL